VRLGDVSPSNTRIEPSSEAEEESGKATEDSAAHRTLETSKGCADRPASGGRSESPIARLFDELDLLPDFGPTRISALFRVGHHRSKRTAAPPTAMSPQTQGHRFRRLAESQRIMGYAIVTP